MSYFAKVSEVTHFLVLIYKIEIKGLIISNRENN